MSNTYIYKHRRGTSEKCNVYDVVLENGEIAIEDCGDARRGILIGDGQHTYAELPKIYLHEAMTKTTMTSLPAENWVGEVSPYYQQVIIEGITAYSTIDLQPTPELLAYLQEHEIALTALNNEGIVTAYALGEKLERDIQIQCIVTEVKSTY